MIETTPPREPPREPTRQRRRRLPPAARERLLREIAREGLPPLPDPAELRAALEEARAEAPTAPVPDEAPLAAPAISPAPEAVAEAAAPPFPDAGIAVGAATGSWAALRPLSIDAGLLARNLVIAAGRSDPAHGAFDVLRTRLVKALGERGWRRVGITSPTKGCGKSFTAVNLAVALSRYDGLRTALLDMDLRQPALARYLGLPDPGAMGDFLRGLVAPADFFRRPGANGLHIGPTLAIGANGRREAYAAELLHEPRTAAALARMQADLAPDVVLFDLPPALAQDDVIALRASYDCVLMVVGGGQTTPRELREAVRRLGHDTPILGVVLNKAEGEGIADYSYD